MSDYKELLEHPELSWGYIDELRAAIEQLVKERDAAVKDMETIANNMLLGCEFCKKNCTEQANCLTGESRFEWRGVQDDK